jgi:hypothetical protein
MSRLLDFYRGDGNDSEGRSLSDLWDLSDDEMEAVHDFIQWMFPLREPSRFNPSAPLLSDADIASFRAEPQLRENLLRSFVAFLAFLGLAYVEGQVVKAPDFDTKRAVFAAPNHNWLRISRVLTSTRILGLEIPSRAFFAFLKELHDSGAAPIPADTFRYWRGAAGADGPESGA